MAESLAQLDLSLPQQAPELLKEYSQSISVDSSSFAVYSMVPGMAVAHMEQIANIAQEEYEDYEYPGQLARPAKPTFDFAGKSLKDIVAAHSAMDKGIKERDDGGKMDKYFFDPKSMFMALTDVLTGSHGMNEYKKWRDIDGSKN
ncbi:hypothetical protein GGR52DRAFT_574380 [Hypoxylon sp. FL1284]|nr:hypothetical protein GGR52DRAFT_574380 [Hypoxylon sp. FL1284]